MAHPHALSPEADIKMEYFIFGHHVTIDRKNEAHIERMDNALQMEKDADGVWRMPEAPGQDGARWHFHPYAWSPV